MVEHTPKPNNRPLHCNSGALGKLVAGPEATLAHIPQRSDVGQVLWNLGFFKGSSGLGFRLVFLKLLFPSATRV